MSLKSEILALDKSGAITGLKSRLAELDSSVQKIAPIIGIYRYQIKKLEGDLKDATKGLPPESIAESTLRNAKAYEDVFREHVLSGEITEDSYMALSYADCHALKSAHKIANLAAKKGGASNLKVQEKQRDLMKSGKSAKEVLKAVKAAARPIIAELATKEDEREAARIKREAESKAEKAAFDAWKASGKPAENTPPPPPAIKSASEAMETIKGILDALPPRQRDKMPDMLRALADFMERPASEPMSTPDNIIKMAA